MEMLLNLIHNSFIHKFSSISFVVHFNLQLFARLTPVLTSVSVCHVFVLQCIFFKIFFVFAISIEMGSLSLCMQKNFLFYTKFYQIHILASNIFSFFFYFLLLYLILLSHKYTHFFLSLLCVYLVYTHKQDFVILLQHCYFCE